jgi:mRNA interferase HicA
MKRRDLEKQLTEYGWYFLRHGGAHDVWTNGRDMEYVPRHREVAESLAKKILRVAWRNRTPTTKGEKP